MSVQHDALLARLHAARFPELFISHTKSFRRSLVDLVAVSSDMNAARMTLTQAHEELHAEHLALHAEYMALVGAVAAAVAALDTKQPYVPPSDAIATPAGSPLDEDVSPDPPMFASIAEHIELVDARVNEHTALLVSILAVLRTHGVIEP